MRKISNKAEGLRWKMLFVSDLEESASDLESAVDGYGFFRLAGVEDGFLKELQEHLVEALEPHDGTVITLHELFYRQVMVIIGVPKQVCQLTLMVKQQAVFRTTRQHMEGKTYTPQKVLALHQGLVFFFGQEAMGYQFVKVAGIEMPFGDPSHHLNISQPSGAFFDIWFKFTPRYLHSGGTVAVAPCHLA